MSPDTYLAAPPAAEGDNYTMYDINIDEVDVTLSLWRWLDGKGLIKDASVKGVRGVIGKLSSLFKSRQELMCRSTLCMVGYIQAIATRGFPPRNPTWRFRVG